MICLYLLCRLDSIIIKGLDFSCFELDLFKQLKEVEFSLEI